MTPRARTPMASLYTRTIHDDFGETVQYLRRKADGTWEGWERYDDGRESDVLAVTLAVLPLGYVPVQP
jgi:hypothetical protein